MLTVVVALAVAFCLAGAAFALAAILGDRSARKENARRQERYLEECDDARRRGLPPPIPPNVNRWG